MRLLLLAALCTGRLLQAALPEFLPPDTKVIVGFSLRGLIDSPLLKGIDISGAKAAAPGFLMTGPLAGLDPLKDLDDLIVASTGQGDKAPTLLVLRGRFSQHLLARGLPLYNGVPIFEEKKPNGTVAQLDESTLLAGDPKMVRAAIDRRGKALALPASFQERAQALESQYDIWGFGDLPPGFAKSTGTAAPPELQAIDRFEFGASLRRGLEVTGQIHVRTSKDAEKMAQTLKMIELMLAMQQPSANGTKFDLQSNDGTFKLSLFIPEEELKKGFAQKANFASSLVSGTTAETPKAMVITSEPTPGSIVKNQRGDAVTVTLPRK